MSDVIADLVRIRKEKGVRQGALAERLGVGQSTLSHWENGERIPDPIKLAAWTEALGQELAVIETPNLRQRTLEELARRHPKEFEALLTAEKYRMGDA